MEKQKNNLVLAIVMSIFAGLPGCLILGVLMNLGIIASISGLVVVALMYIAFKKFYKTDKKWVFAYVTVVSILEIVIATIVADGIVVLRVLKEEGITITFAQAIQLLFANKEMLAALLTDLISSLLFALIGIVCFVVQENRKQKAIKEQQLRQEQFEKQSDVQREAVQNRLTSANKAELMELKKRFDAGEITKEEFKARARQIINK